MFTEAPVSVSVTTTHYYKSEMEVYQLANIKSAKKRILVNRTKAARNKSIRSAVKTSIKKVETAVQKNDKAAAQAALTEAISTISKATSKGVYHKNNCARKISRLSKAVNSIGKFRLYIFNYKLIIKKTVTTVSDCLFYCFNLIEFYICK